VIPKIRILTSWVYMNPALYDILRGPEVDEWTLDSGAYSFVTRAKHEYAPLRKYMDFLEKLPHKPKWYIQLDEVGKPEVTQSNLKEMRDAGFDPIPVFTRGAPLSDLYEIHDDGAKMVCFGGLATSKRGKSRRTSAFDYLRYLMENERHPEIPTHLLGVGAEEILNYYLPESVDSTGWLNSNKRGILTIYHGNGRWGRDMALKKGEVQNLTVEEQQAIREVGYDPEIVRRSVTDHQLWLPYPKHGYDTVPGITMAMWLRYAHDLDRRGCTFWFATANGLHFTHLFEARRRGIECGLYHEGGDELITDGHTAEFMRWQGGGTWDAYNRRRELNDRSSEQGIRTGGGEARMGMAEHQS